MLLLTKVPKIQPLIIFGDGTEQTARLLSIVGRKGMYTAVVEYPRLTRQDSGNEVIRAVNAAARVRPKSVFMVDAGEEMIAAMNGRIPDKMLVHINEDTDIYAATGREPRPKLQWGQENLAVGLFKALIAGSELDCTGSSSSETLIDYGGQGHLVICEQGEPLSELIAAQYAFSIGSSFCVIPRIDDGEADNLCEQLYSAMDKPLPGEPTTTDRLTSLKAKLRQLIPIDTSAYRHLTFITTQIPFGFAFPELPTAHVFTYPNMGINLVSAFAEEAKASEGIQLAMFIDPKKVDGDEVKKVADNLAMRSALIRIFQGRSANVYDVTRAIDLIPYDFLLISTHCGDASGWRWTYKFSDREGIERELVVDIAIGVGSIPSEKDMMEVMKFMRFVSLDGVDWNDKEAKAKHYVGTAMLDFDDLLRLRSLEPVKKVSIPRVAGSSALKMYDNHYILPALSVAGRQTPIILNNACCSWHRLAGDFMFCGARAYIGTLFEVLDPLAAEIGVKLSEKYYGKPLSVALWRAQNDVFGDSVNRPYVLVGPHFQRIQVRRGDAASIIKKRFVEGLAILERQAKSAVNDDRSKKEASRLDFFKREAAAFRDLILNRQSRS